MSIRMTRLAGAALSVGILFFANGASADQRGDEMVNQVLELLNAAQQTLSDPGELTPDKKERALGQIHEAMDMLIHFQQGSK
jgi:hypothetical protein